jgi:hypothetical protein
MTERPVITANHLLQRAPRLERSLPRWRQPAT